MFGLCDCKKFGKSKCQSVQNTLMPEMKKIISESEKLYLRIHTLKNNFLGILLASNCLQVNDALDRNSLSNC